MEERKGYHCPVEATLDLIRGKYKTLILWHLAGAPAVQPAPAADFPATPKMLTQQLRELEEDGVIHREVFQWCRHGWNTPSRPGAEPAAHPQRHAGLGGRITSMSKNLEPNCSMTGRSAA